MSQVGILDIEATHPQIPTEFDADSGSAIPIANVLNILGSTVANSTNAKPLFTTGSGNTITAEIQVSADRTGAPGDKLDAGICSFDDSNFLVDGDGYVQFIGSASIDFMVTVDDSTAPGTNPVLLDGSGNITIIGDVVASHSVPIETHSRAANEFSVEVQVSSSITGAPGDKLDAGVCSFDDTAFSVDSDGYVTLVSGPGPTVDSIDVDYNTAPGTDPVLPDVNGLITVSGSTVANATNAKPLATHSRSDNSYNIEVQVATERTGAPGDKLDAGLSSYDDTQFAVDADGYVTLVGGANLPAVQTITSDDPTVVGPDGSGNIDLTGETVANATNAKPVFVDAGANALNIEVQVAADRTGAPGDKLDAGVCSFDDTAFSVDADGYVTLVGGLGPSIDSVDVDFNTGPGTDPVVPDGAGGIVVSGSTVANATNLDAPIATHSRAANSYSIEVQVAAAITGSPADKFDAGICSFDDTAFSVDANGYVTLAGGVGPAVDTNTGDDASAVTPDGSGNFNWLGVTVANATHAKPVYFKDSATANAIDLDVQVASDRTGAPGDKNDAGLSSYDDTQFAVDADGYVTLVGGANLPAIQTITSDDPTVVGPDGSGNIDLTGEAVNNATNAKPVFVDAGANALNIEVQVAAKITGAPANNLNAGICSFDDTTFDVDTNGYVTLVGGGGVCVETNTGDDSVSVGPSAAGDFGWIGVAVANATHAKPVYFKDSATANSLDLDVQVATDITGAPGDKNDAGLASFDDNSFLVDTDGYVMSLSGIQPGVSNLGFSYAVGTGVFTIHGHDGTALSATNPATIWMQSDDTSCYLKKFSVTANQSFIDDNGASEIIDNTFGSTAGTAWAQDCPFFIYAVANGDPGGNGEPAIAFMLSRVPHATNSPSDVTIIGAPDDSVADKEYAFWSLDNITETDYTSQPALCIGSFRMRKTSSDDWTVQTLSITDGIGQFNDKRSFTMPILQNGATSVYYSSSVGGDTIPTFSSYGYAYWISKDGWVRITTGTTSVTVSGVGSGSFRIHVPMSSNLDSSFYNEGTLSYANGSNWVTCNNRIDTGAFGSSRFFESIFTGTSSTKLKPGDFTTGASTANLGATFFYPAAKF